MVTGHEESDRERHARNGAPSSDGPEANDVAQAVAHLITMCVLRDVFFMVVVPGDCGSFLEYPVVARALRLGAAAVATTYQGNWDRTRQNKETLVSSNIPTCKMAVLECDRPLPDPSLLDEMGSTMREYVKWMGGCYEINNFAPFYDSFAKMLVTVCVSAAGFAPPVWEDLIEVSDSD